MRRGRLEVITGPMFSGKSRELIRRLEAASASGDSVVGFKSYLDTRHDDARIASHDGLRFPCTPVRSARDVLMAAGGAGMVGIDEAQFFEDDLVPVCLELVRAGKRVVLAGLHEDYLGRPFGAVPALTSLADEAVTLMATCASCGSPAAHTTRIVSVDERVVVGGTEAYAPLCSRCFGSVEEP